MPYSIVKLINNKNFKFDVNLLKPFFNKLTLDNYDEELYKLTPFRARKVLYLNYNKGRLVVNKVKKSFSQNVSDLRSKERRFEILKPNKNELKTITEFVFNYIDLIEKEVSIKNKELEITIHFVKIFASKEGQTNSPEGIHRDGFDILMPCFVVERKNITGGISRFYKNKVCIYKKQINEGQGLFLLENMHKDIYHDVTPIYSCKKEGFRSIIGVDINFK